MVENFSRRLKGAWKQIFGEGFDRCFNPVESHGLRAVCHQEFPSHAPFVAAWDALLAATPEGTTFHSHIWQKAVFETLGKADRLRLLAVWQGARLVAVLPMHMRDDGLLETLAPGVTDYLDPLILPGMEREAWQVLLKLLARLRAHRWKNVTLHNVREDSPTRAILTELAGAEGFDIESRIAEHCPALALPPTWEEYLATLDGHERKETRRKINKVMSKGNGRVVRCSGDAAEIGTTLGHAFGLMEQAPGEKGEAVKKVLRPLLEKAAPPLIASGRLWLTTLCVNDEPAAVTLQFPHAGGPMLYNCGYDNAKREWSPGVVLTALIIQQAIESGATTFDLLRGEEAYKYRLGAVNRPLYMVSLKRR